MRWTEWGRWARGGGGSDVFSKKHHTKLWRVYVRTYRALMCMCAHIQGGDRGAGAQLDGGLWETAAGAVAGGAGRGLGVTLCVCTYLYTSASVSALYMCA